MSRLPVRQGPEGAMLPAQLELAAQIGGSAPVSELWGVLRRNWWIILGCIMLCAGAAVYMTVRTTPLYRSATSIRIGDKQSALPELALPFFSSGSEVSTEMEVLESRSLAEDAVSGLALQLSLLEPTRRARSDLLSGIHVPRDARPAVYVLTRGEAGHYTITLEKDDAAIAKVAPGKPAQFDGITFALRPEAARHERIRIRVVPFGDAVAGVTHAVEVTRSGRETKIVTLTYRTSDPELASQVPNLIAQQFVARRDAAHKAATGTTIAFLRQQLDTLANQLRSAESALLAYRERERVVNPEVEGSSQVNRLVQIQNERSILDAERAALAQLLAEVQVAAARQRPEDPSAYRALLAFPTLLRNQAATRLLENLSSVEEQRSALLARRTPADPDVEALTSRIKAVEEDLHSMAGSYLQGLTLQVASFDSTLRGFGRQLQQVPQRELQYSRLVRQPKLLEELFALLQTRLKEAEITQAASDLSVQVVDPAIRPRRPFQPRRAANLFVGVVLGSLLGTAVAFLREFLDKAVHTRADVLLATGLSVIGLIPRIPRTRGRFALISEKGSPRHAAEATGPSAPPAPRVYSPPPTHRTRYTFLGPVSSDPISEEVQPGFNGAAPPVAPPVLPAGVKRLVLSDRGAGAMEAYGSLLTNLSFSLPDPPRVVAFTSALPGEGKTTNAVNLALSLAHRGSKVLLVDGDLRRGIVHSLFEAPREPGLTNVLWGSVSFEQARRTLEIGQSARLDYLTTGTLPPNPTSLVESAIMRTLLDGWREQYDSVIIDTPPVNVITDAALLGASADGVVLVARAGVTHAAALGYALEQLRRVQAQVLGVVLSDIDFARDSAYDPTYRYHRYDQYTADKS